MWYGENLRLCYFCKIWGKKEKMQKVYVTRVTKNNHKYTKQTNLCKKCLKAHPEVRTEKRTDKKKCKRCKQYLPLSNFTINKYGNIYHVCKECFTQRHSIIKKS